MISSTRPASLRGLGYGRNGLAPETCWSQGQPDLTAWISRVFPDGSRPVRAISLPTYYSYYVQTPSMLMFDVHPDGRRIIAPMLESHEADIEMIENLP
jgi:hypothetical protein